MGTSVRTGLRGYGEAVKQRARVVVNDSRQRFVNYCAALCPYDLTESDDFHMVEHIRADPLPSGLGYDGGFRSKDFREAGQADYFIFTEFGTTRMSAQPCVFPARDLEEPQFVRELREAMQPRPGDRR